MTGITDDTVSVRYLVDDVQTAIDFYTTHLGFTVTTAFVPAFADVLRGNMWLLLPGQLRRPGDTRRPHPAPGRLEPHPPARDRRTAAGSSSSRSCAPTPSTTTTG
ncbi:VOC family protein [Dactylosporangium sp. McL0621]|uniref:VOC family protein n=1 Tax=Dactylosporangium sp. McL0621 TaxID=3415678 RepID=UPI003CED18C3